MKACRVDFCIRNGDVLLSRSRVFRAIGIQPEDSEYVLRRIHTDVYWVFSLSYFFRDVRMELNCHGSMKE